jgi:hypothetical protein
MVGVRALVNQSMAPAEWGQRRASALVDPIWRAASLAEWGRRLSCCALAAIVAANPIIVVGVVAVAAEQ